MTHAVYDIDAYQPYGEDRHRSLKEESTDGY